MNESTLNQLFRSAVEAFPGTRKRQHATGPIQINELTLNPFLGMGTLFVKAEALSNGNIYHPIILFKNVKYGSGNSLLASDGQRYEMEPLSVYENDVVLRCDCQDFYWRFNYYDHIDRSLCGRKRRKYESKGVEPPVNPLEMPGMCKHLMKLMENLRSRDLV